MKTMVEFHLPGAFENLKTRFGSISTIAGITHQTKVSKYSNFENKFFNNGGQPLAERFHGVVVSTLDFESSDLGSTPGGTSCSVAFISLFQFFFQPT